MKIRSKIALRYTSYTAFLIVVFAITIYIMAAHDREAKFFKDLRKEGLSRASLYLEGKVEPKAMHSIYLNNIKYINEVEVAVYSSSHELLYHDAKDIDIVKETPELLDEILNNRKDISFYEGKYQVTGFPFIHNNKIYAVTAAAYDGYGYDKLRNLALSLAVVCTIFIGLSFILGYYLAKRALKPVSDISEKMKDITANNLSMRLFSFETKDEFGELATAFNKALDIIEGSFQSQKMFVSNVSHELRTPLSAIIGEADLALLKEHSCQEYKEALTNIRIDSKRLIVLINGLLDLAKVDYDESKISFTEVRLDEVLLDARELVLKANLNYIIDLQFDLQSENDREAIIHGNEYLLRLAFVNLIQNNCKFSENNTSVIQITVANKKIILSFSDSGIGIPQQDINNIFIPFYRGTNKAFASGNGIGLALVQRIVCLHKGTIEVSSKVGYGTTFRLSWFFKNDF